MEVMIMNKERIEQIMEKVTKRNLANVLCGNKTSEVDNEILELLNEVTKLTNNWNELEELISNLLKEADSTKSDLYIYEQNKAIMRMILDKMKEIKEGHND